MKVIVKKKKRQEVEYPCLMESDDGTIVMFSSERHGTVVGITNCVKKWEYGYYSDTWLMYRFKPFKGHITLSNEE